MDRATVLGFLDEGIGDLDQFWDMWDDLVTSAPTVWPGPTVVKWPGWAGAIGTGFDRRLRALAVMDPLPTSVPEPPPWHPGHLCGFPVEANIHRLSFVRRDGGIGMRSCDSGNDPGLLADIDMLTEMAVAKLLAPFAEVPLARRHASVQTTDMVEMGCVQGQFFLHMPDLILGDTVIELKTNRKPDPVEIVWQLGHLVLQDRYDRYGLRNVATYLARQGALIKLPVTDFFRDVHDMAELQTLRERYRVARGEAEQTWLLERYGRNAKRGQAEAMAVAVFFHLVARQTLPTAREPFAVDVLPGSDEVGGASAALKDFPLVDVLDAIRGWRVALVYGLPAWATTVWSIDDLLTPERVRQLSDVVRLGPTPQKP